MALTDDEYTCLMIMKDGENLIRMRDTRWYRPLTDLDGRGLIKAIGNENFVITHKGLAALQDHEQMLHGEIQQRLGPATGLTATQRAIHRKMQDAITALVDAARAGANVTGETPVRELEKIGREVLTRALAALQQ